MVGRVVGKRGCRISWNAWSSVVCCMLCVQWASYKSAKGAQAGWLGAGGRP